jgi:hypothetical protein
MASYLIDYMLLYVTNFLGRWINECMDAAYCIVIMFEFLFLSPWTWAGSVTQSGMPAYVSVLHIPQMIWVWRATMEWYIDREKPKNSEKNLS